jgi:EmrB/QacA subfamily drug resistance transporter
MCFALFMIMLDNTVVNVALPSIQRSLKTTPQNLEWTVNAYVLSFATLILLGGKLGDRFGRKRMFLAGLILFTASSAACALSTSDTELISFRVIQGVGGALLNPLSLSILVAAFPRRQLPTAIGVWAGISGLGLAVGPLAGGFLTQHYSWSYVFWINVPIGLIASLVTLWAVIESRDPSARKLDLPGTALVTAGLFALTWALIKTGTHAWLSAYTLGFLAAAVVLLAAFLVWESRTDQPMLPLGFFRRPAFTSSSIVVTLVGFGLFGVIYFITLYFQNVKDYSPLNAGVRSLPMTMMIMVFAPIGGKLNLRVGPRALMSVGMLLAAAGLFGLSHVQPGSSYNLIWPMYVLMGIGMALTMPAVSATGMAAVDQAKAGIASGVINASRQVGGALGIAVLGTIGTSVAANSWHTKIAGLPPAHHAAALRLTALVEGGQSRLVGHYAGPVARAAANDAFVSGVREAMLVGSGLMLLAGVVAFVGLRGHVPAHAGERPVAVEV